MARWDLSGQRNVGGVPKKIVKKHRETARAIVELCMGDHAVTRIDDPVYENARWHMRHRPYGIDGDDEQASDTE